MRIPSGGKIALTGESGSGKSTIIKLLFRYDTDYQGTILVGGKNLKDLDPESFYQHISMIPQFPFLFSDTIRNNICLGKPYSDEQVENAIQKARLKPFIETLPEGEETLLTENGRNLSGGQAQRIAIARAIISGSDMILVDEATSNLDPVIGDALEQYYSVSSSNPNVATANVEYTKLLFKNGIYDTKTDFMRKGGKVWLWFWTAFWMP